MGREDFLFELYTEEIPASYQAQAEERWSQTLPKLFDDSLLSYEKIKIYATPRRLAAFVKSLSEFQLEEEEILRGPPEYACYDSAGKATKALEGFARKSGVQLENVYFEQEEKGKYAKVKVKKGGRNLTAVLPQILENLIHSVRFPKTMHWGSKTLYYARPVLFYVAKYGQSPVLLEGSSFFSELQVRAHPIGHFIQGPFDQPLKNASDYYQHMQSWGILADSVERREYILQEAHSLAKTAGLSPILPENLLNEINFLVESPKCVLGSFDASYLDLPEVVCISEMQEHQRYIPLRKDNGELANQFIIVANGVRSEIAEENIRTGNERVFRARLADGAFFYEEDRKIPLSERREDLRRIVFQEGLGSMYDKTHRLSSIGLNLGDYMHTKLDADHVVRAAELSKADLTTQLVYEFDHLQGEIGAIYAQKDGEDEEVCKAIFEHYLPRHQSDLRPKSNLGIILALAEKLDNVLAGLLIGKEPSSSQDPLGLRRQTLYAIEIAIEARLDLDLPALASALYALYPQSARSWAKEEGIAKDEYEFGKRVWKFFKNRLATIFEKAGVEKRLANAGLSREEGRLLALYDKLSALQQLKDSRQAQDFDKLLGAFKRMSNILKDADEAGAAYQYASISEKDLSEPEAALNRLAWELNQHIARKNSYFDVFSYLASQREVVDRFFDEVMVMHEDKQVKARRLALLEKCVTPIRNILDLDQLL